MPAVLPVMSAVLPFNCRSSATLACDNPNRTTATSSDRNSIRRFMCVTPLFLDESTIGYRQGEGNVIVLARGMRDVALAAQLFQQGALARFQAPHLPVSRRDFDEAA